MSRLLQLFNLRNGWEKFSSIFPVDLCDELLDGKREISRTMCPKRPDDLPEAWKFLAVAGRQVELRRFEMQAVFAEE